METPDLSIILPVFNGANFISHAIESILNQSFSRWELIIINDGSADATESYCKKYCAIEERILYISQPNRGLSAARNSGLRKAKGKFITFLDADDYVEPDYYQKLIMASEKVDADFIVAGFTRDFIQTNGNKHSIVTCFPQTYLKNTEAIVLFSKNLFFYNVYIHVWNKLYLRDNLLRHNISFDETYNYAEDVPFNIQVLKISETILFLEQTGYHYICHHAIRLTNEWKRELPEYNRKIYSLIALQQKMQWGIIDSPVPAGMYLRSCFLALENALSKRISPNQLKEISKQLIRYPETKTCCNICFSLRVSPEFILYSITLKTCNPTIIYYFARMRRIVKHLLKR